MSVSTTHPEYDKAKPRWKYGRDAVGGQEPIKKGRTVYLPASFAKTDADRYDQYLERSYYVNYTGRTRDAMVGMVFRKGVMPDLPPRLEPLINNIDGSGQSLEQLAKDAVDEVMVVGRFGLLADYPESQEGMDAETEQRLDLRPMMLPYDAESIINWRYETVSGRKVLTMVVLRESVEVSGQDEFGHDCEYNYRVLRLRDGIYTSQTYDDGGTVITDEYEPRMSGGASFDHIPFYFSGSTNNFPDCDIAPLFDLAVVNVAHYRNTADIEESGFIAGQPTLHIDVGQMSTQEWKNLNPNGVQIGSRSGVVTSGGGSMSLVQANETSLPLTLTERKEQQMVAIGARLVQRGGQAETAEAARINASAESSTLDTVVDNVSEAIEASLKDMALFLGENPDSISYQLNKNFWESGLSPQDLTAIQNGVGRLYGPMDAIEMIRSGRIYIPDSRETDDILADAASSGMDVAE